MPMIPVHPVLFGLAAMALLAGTIGVGQLRGDFPERDMKVEVKAEAEPRVKIHLANLCVTKGGLCKIRPMPAGQSCSCPTPLRGQTSGQAYSEAELVTNPEHIPTAGSDADKFEFGAEP